jgi:predicted permease
MWLKRRDPRLRDEIRFHRDRLIEEYVAAGMKRQDAERRAFLEFGNAAQIEEACLDVRGRWAADFAQDLRYAARMLRRSPAFSTVAVLSLALGIGANAAIFSLVNAVMLRSLPVKEPGRLVQITRLNGDGQPAQVSYPLFEYFRDNVKSISGAFVESTTSVAITIDGEEEFVAAELVSGDYYTILGVEPVAGRLLTRADDQLSTTAAAIISDRYWQRRFGRRASAVGRTFTIRDRVFTIVGVTPPSFISARTGYLPDVTLPLLLMMPEQQRRSADFNFLKLLARLKPGATVEQANAETQVLFSGFAQSQAATAPARQRDLVLRQRAAALPASDGFNAVRDNASRPLLILMGIVTLILMLTCVNVSGLLLARAAARQREISIRLAIGAGRGRLIRQFLTETLLLASGGGAIGLLMAGWLSERLFTLFINGRELELSVTPDWHVLVFTAGLCVLSCLIAGLAPAFQARRTALNPGLKEVRAQTHGRLGRALVVTQLAISMVLVVGAALFVGTLIKLYTVDRGFNSDGLLVVNIRSTHPYSDDEAPIVRRAVLEQLTKLAGVESASAAQILPVGGSLWDRTIEVEGYSFRPDESDTVGFNVIAPDYFRTLGTPLIAGRDFSDRDTPQSPMVAVVNETFARHFFGVRSALGRHVTSVNVTYEIVGVVRDAKYQDLRTGTIKTMYIPWTQREGDQPTRYSYLARLAAGDPRRLAPGLGRLIRETDPGLRLRTAVAYSQLIDRSISTERIMATLGGLFGVLAIVIAALGMFGLLAFHVARRTNELGVRMALGASRGRMMGLVLRDVAVLVATGIVIGGGAALMLSGLAGKILFGLTPTDPRVFGIAASILAGAALAAGWLPARRAARVDPLIALRHE